MEGDNELRLALIDFIRKTFPDGFIFQAVVKDVDMSTKTCTVVTEGMTEEIPGILLQPNLNSAEDGILPIPVKGSDVWCGVLNNDESQIFILKCTEVEEYIINVKQTTFNKGNNGGMVIVGKADDNLKTIKQYVLDLKTAVATALGSIDGSIAGVGGASTSASVFNPAMAAKSMNLKDMENKKVKH